MINSDMDLNDKQNRRSWTVKVIEIRGYEKCKNNLSGLEICLRERRLLQLFYHQSVPSLLILKSNEFLLASETLVFISAVKITQKVAEL